MCTRSWERFTSSSRSSSASGTHLHAVESLHDTLSPFDGLFLANVFRPGKLGRLTLRISKATHKMLESELWPAKCIEGACLCRYHAEKKRTGVLPRSPSKGVRFLVPVSVQTRRDSLDHVGFQPIAMMCQQHSFISLL